MLNVTIKGDAELMARFRQFPEHVRAALLKKVWSLTLKLEAKIKTEKLSGQVLNVISGALRRSISSNVEETKTSVIGSATQSGDVKYGRPHEFGFVGPVSVGAHTRTITQAFGRAISSQSVDVSAHTRAMNLPERSFMRSSLADMRPQIIAGLTEAVHEGLNAK